MSITEKTPVLILLFQLLNPLSSLNSLTEVLRLLMKTPGHIVTGDQACHHHSGNAAELRGKGCKGVSVSTFPSRIS